MYLATTRMRTRSLVLGSFFIPQPLDEAPLDKSKTKMMLAELPPQFKDMKNVTIALGTSFLSPVLGPLHLDNVEHCNNN